MVLVSACLLGLCTRHDGTSALDERAVQLLKEAKAIPVCPEQLAGLPTPRPRIALFGGNGKDVISGRGQVLTEDGRDVTKNLIEACKQIVRLAKISPAETALLKEGSPSCGVTETSIDWQQRPGMGVLAAALLQAGIDTTAI